AYSPACDLIIGRINQFHLKSDLYEGGRIDAKGLAAVSRFAGNNYAEMGEILKSKGLINFRKTTLRVFLL
ncbi:hypothetical protein V7128_26115, partial [Neobacillus vireti]